ncbi:5-formyltetrahydrofolate cyclo-ligase [Geoalkalibacter halelectricus]|uniref:5-formyltetrahydrofolate cyclo-ligase n=1 Tax=Geoalkalibacter halelectricus TaxID=2847045 RepID=UPI003D1E5CAB
MAKSSIRDNLLARRRHLAVDTCLSWSRQAQQRLIDTEVFGGAQTLALYSPINNEVFTEDLFAAAQAAKKRVAYPRVQGQSLVFVEVAGRGQLVHGRFGILEPAGDRIVSAADLDLLVLPGVAFDARGHRLGYGKGFYDRSLQQFRGRGIRVGLCFEFQRVDALPAEAHDVPMDLVVTEMGIFPANNPGHSRANS